MSDSNEVAAAVMERLDQAVRADIGLNDVLESARDELQAEALYADARGEDEDEVRELRLLEGLVEVWAREQRVLEAWGAAIETAQEAADAGLELAHLYGGVRARLAAVEAERNRLAAAVATLERSVDGRLKAGDATVASLLGLVERLAKQSARAPSGLNGTRTAGSQRSSRTWTHERRCDGRGARLALEARAAGDRSRAPQRGLLPQGDRRSRRR